MGNFLVCNMFGFDAQVRLYFLTNIYNTNSKVKQKVQLQEICNQENVLNTVEK